MTVEVIRDISWLCDYICTNSQYILTTPVDIVLEKKSTQKEWGGYDTCFKSWRKTGENRSYERKKIPHQFS